MSESEWPREGYTFIFVASIESRTKFIQHFSKANFILFPQIFHITYFSNNVLAFRQKEKEKKKEKDGSTELE